MKLFDPAIFGPDNDLPRPGVLEKEDPLRRERHDEDQHFIFEPPPRGGPLSRVVKSDSLWVHLHSTDLPSSTLLPSLEESKLSSAPSKSLLFKADILDGLTVV